VTCRPIARERVDPHVSVDTGIQQAFPWILIRCITGHSDENAASRSSDQNCSTTEYSGVVKYECPVEEDDSVSDSDLL
jgi:hypothetical protein